MRRIIALSLSAGLAASAAGQSFEWATAVDGNWNNVANWSPMGVPQGFGQTATLGLTGAYTVNVDLSPSIDGVSLTNPDATLAIDAGRTFSTGAVNNGGLIVVNPNAAAAATTLRLTSDLTFTGTGVLRLHGVGTRARIVGVTSSTVFTNGADHTLEGFGQIIVPCVNDGLIDANVPGTEIDYTLVPLVTNNATMTATNGGRLTLRVGTVDQTGGGEIVANGGLVSIQGSEVLGGMIREVAPGDVVELRSSADIIGVTVEGGAEVPIGQSARLGGAITNNGVVRVNPTGAAAVTSLLLNDATVLGGTGEVRLGGFGLRARLGSVATGDVAINASGHGIRGYGEVIVDLVNNGDIAGDDPLGTLEIEGSTVTNNARITAQSGGTTEIRSVIDQTGGGVIETDGGTIFITGGTVVGGTIRQNGADTLEVRQAAQLEGVTLEGDIIHPGGSNNRVLTSLTNNGLYRINPAAIAAVTPLQFDNNAAINGSGVIRLSGFSTRAQLNGIDESIVVTHSNGHEIRGFGRIDVGMINNGVIAADEPGQTLDIEEDIENNAEIRGENGGVVQASATFTIDQAGGGSMIAEGGDIEIDGATIVSGTLDQRAGGEIRVIRSSTFNSVTIEGGATITAGDRINVVQALENNGELLVNPTGISALTGINFNAFGVLIGTGRVMLAGLLNRAQITADPAAGQIRNEGDHVIAGVGRIEAPLRNEGVIEPGIDGVGTLNASAPIEFASTGAYRVDIIQELANIQSDVFDSTAAVDLGGDLEIVFTPGFEPVPPVAAPIVTTTTAGVISGRFDAITGDAPAPPFVVRVYYSPTEVQVGFTCVADYALPVGVLDIADVVAFLQLFGAGDPTVDLAAPFGSFDIADVVTFLQAFGAGCP